jgi:hypothetical protein
MTTRLDPVVDELPGVTEEKQAELFRPLGISRLMPRHFRCIELALDGLGPREIGPLVGLSSGSVGVILSSEVVQEELARRRSGINLRADEARACGVRAVDLAEGTLAMSSVSAAEKLDELVGGEDQQLSFKAASKILEIALGRGGDRRGPTVGTLNIEQLNMLGLVAKEAGLVVQAPIHEEVPAGESALVEVGK